MNCDPETSKPSEHTENAHAATHGPVFVPDPSLPPRILVVDDERSIRTVLKNTLLANGFRVLTASSGQKALSLLRKESDIDLVLLDILMPKISGYDVMVEIRSDPSLSALRVIVLSALAGTGEKMKAFSHGAVDFVVKPFDQGEVVARVRTHVDFKRAEEALRLHQDHLEHLIEERTAAVTFLSRSAMDFLEMESTRDIYPVIASRLKEISGATIVVVSSLDEKEEHLHIRAISGLGQRKTAVARIMGKDPVGMTITLDRERNVIIGENELVRLSGDLHDISFGTISRKISGLIWQLIGIDSIYTMNFVLMGERFGNVTFILGKNDRIRHKEAIKAFIWQASVALQKRLVENQNRNETERYRNVVVNASHLVHTPLTVVKGHLELISRGKQEPSPELLRKLMRKVEEIQTLVDGKLFENIDFMTVETSDGLTPVARRAPLDETELEQLIDRIDNTDE